MNIIITFGCILESIIKNTYINKRIIDPLFKSRGFVKDCKNEDRLKALDSKIDQKVEDVKKQGWGGDGYRRSDQEIVGQNQ